MPRTLWMACALGMTMLCAQTASAATITVPTTSDVSASQCTLRDAIAAANTNAVAGACPAGSGTDDIQITATGTIALGSILPFISSDLNIQGPGVGQLTVNGQSNGFRIFTVGIPDPVTAAISGLTVVGGGGASVESSSLPLEATGAGIYNHTGSTVTLERVSVSNNTIFLENTHDTFDIARIFGTGISNRGTMTISRSTVAGNVGSAAASGDSPGGTHQAFSGGAGVFNDGTLLVERSTISNNWATANFTGTAGIAGLVSAEGGGLWTGSGKVSNVRLSTVSGNVTTASSATQPTGGAGISAGPGGVFGPITAVSDTIAFNSSVGTANIAGSGTLQNTIVSDPQGGGANCG